MALTAEEQINLRVAEQGYTANSERGKHSDNQLYSLEDLFNLPIESIKDNVYKVVTDVETTE